MTNYYGDYPINAVVDLKWNTNGQDGASITRGTDGTLRIYKNNATAERTSLNGVTQTEDFDGTTGVHHIRIDLSDNTDAGFYVAGSEISVVMAGMVIDTKTVNAEVASFSIERTGGALALLKSRLVGTIATGTHNAQSGDAYARLGAPVGASISADIAGVQSDTDNLQTRLPTSLVSGRMDVSVGAMATDVLTNTALAASAVTEIQTGLASQSSVDAIAGAVDTEVAAIKAKTDQLTFTTANKVDATIQAAGDFAQGAADKAWSTTTRTLTSGANIVLAKGTGVTGFNDLSAAQVNAEVDTALADARLDELLVAEYTFSPTAGSLISDLTESDAGVARFTANALEQAPTGGSAPTAAQIADAVWDETLAGHLTAGSTGAALNGASSAGDPWGTALPGAYGAGSAGNIVGTNLNATVSSRASQTSVDTVQADTDNLQTRLPTTLVSGRIDAHVGSVADAVLTAAKFAAGAFDAVWTVATRTLTAVADSAGVTTLLSRIIGTLAAGTHQPQSGDSFPLVDTEIAAIKAKTDQLVFTTANRVDSTVIDKTGFALSTAGNNAVRDAVTSDIIEVDGSITLQQCLSILLAVCAGETDTGGLVFRTPSGTNVRVSASVDVSNNRTSMTLTPSA